MHNGNKENVRTEGEVQGLCGEVSDDVGSVTSPQRDKTFISICTREAINNALVRGRQAALFNLEEY